MEVFLRDEIKNKNKIINNLLRNFSKPQNLSYKDSNITMEPQEAVKKNRFSKRDNSKRSQDNGIAIVNLDNSITKENVELQNISNIRNNLRKNNVNEDNIVILGDFAMKHVDGWKLSRILKSKNKRVKVMHFSGATTACMESYIKPTFQRN